MAEICPVCGGNEWDVDYDRTGDGEMRVDRCAECGWPPPGPHTVEEWRAKWRERMRPLSESMDLFLNDPSLPPVSNTGSEPK